MSTVDILTSPIINGSPSGSGLPTVTRKRGSGSGTNYTHSGDTSYADVDATKLSYTTTIPIGWKLSVTASGALTVLTAAVAVAVSLYDHATLTEVFASPSSVGSLIPFTLNYVVDGDDSTHTVKMQFKTSVGADAVNIRNLSTTDCAVMIFRLEPAN